MDEEVITKKINLEIDISGISSPIGVNKFQKWIDMAQAVDAWRIFPRAFLSVYIFLLYYSVMWFMGLPEPNLEQSGLISIIVGAGAAWFGLYVGTNGSRASKGDK